MALQIGGNAVPVSMVNRGVEYRFEPARAVRKNGLGVPVTAGAARLTWTWAYMEQEEFDWWHQTACGGAAGKEWSGSGTTRLRNERNVETAFNHCVVQRPTYRTTTGSVYQDVTVVIEQVY